MDVSLLRTGAGTVSVTATLAPRQAGFHLYSVSLPEGGEQGIGIPTRLTVDPPWRGTGTPTASAQPYMLRLAGLDVQLPVYPDGPVTLHLAAALAGDASDRPTDGARGDSVTTVHVRLTYGACSATRGCMMPVRDRVVTFRLP